MVCITDKFAGNCRYKVGILNISTIYGEEAIVSSPRNALVSRIVC